MTIAAGFLYKGGLALCTDTQFTSIFKIHGTKLLRYEYDDGSKSVFATVGNASYGRMGAQLIQDQIADTPKSERTLPKMHLILIAGVKALHQEHIFKHPNRIDIAVQFLVGFWSAKDKSLGFYMTEDTAVVRLYGYVCLGTGQLLGDYILRHKYKRLADIKQRPRHTKQEILKMAADALNEVKQHDPNVGGESQFVTLTDDGRLSPLEKFGASSLAEPPVRTNRGRKARAPQQE
jgi:20S proteasome alpha/beta subunit